MASFFQLRSWINWWLDAVNEHSLHSPFFFDFYQDVIKPGAIPIAEFEALRTKLQQWDQQIEVVDFGTGQGGKSQQTRQVGHIAKYGLTPVKYASLYYRMLKRQQAITVVELGTSLGITSLYLAAASQRLITFEGDPQLSQIARDTFAFAGTPPIELVTGNLDLTLEPRLAGLRQIDFALIDANHARQPTLRYARQLLKHLHVSSVLVIDDIHRSAEMQSAWQELQKEPQVSASLDLWQCGILFFDPSLNNQHVILQY